MDVYATVFTLLALLFVLWQSLNSFEQFTLALKVSISIQYITNTK